MTELEEGTGEPADVGDTVFVNVTSASSARTARDSPATSRASRTRSRSATARSSPGWEEGLVGAPPARSCSLDIPADLAYGDEGVPSESIPEDGGGELPHRRRRHRARRPTRAAPRPTSSCRSAKEPVEEVVIDDVVVGDGAELDRRLDGLRQRLDRMRQQRRRPRQQLGRENRVQLPMTSGQGGLMEGL